MATVTGDPSGAGVTWSLQSSAVLPLGTEAGLTAPFTPLSSIQEDVGSIDQTGAYTGPAGVTQNTPRDVLVVATSISTPSVFATASLVFIFNGNNIYTHAQLKHEQWDSCQRCGFTFPMSRLAKQKGMLLCIRKCWDNLEIERRQIEIGRVLTQGNTGLQSEGSDRRVLDKAFFVPDFWSS